MLTITLINIDNITNQNNQVTTALLHNNKLAKKQMETKNKKATIKTPYTNTFINSEDIKKYTGGRDPPVYEYEEKMMKMNSNAVLDKSRKGYKV